MGLGLAILANSRPFEGLVASLPAALLLFGWLLSGSGPSWSVAFRRLVLPVTGVMLITAAWMAYYNYRVTGNPLRMPYQVYQETYEIIPKFLCLPLNPEPDYRHEVMRTVHAGWEVQMFADQLTLGGYIITVLAKAIKLWAFYLGVLWTIPLIALAWAVRTPWMRFAALACGTLFAVFLVHILALPHYAAPIACLIYLLVVQSMRHLRLWRWHCCPIGRVIVAAIPVLAIAWFIVSLLAGYRADPAARWAFDRASIQANLSQSGEKHLIFVHYEPNHSTIDEWVYNEADIDGSSVVWAREMDAEHNRRLLAYFHDRRAWQVDADAKPVRLRPYPMDNQNSPSRARSGAE